MNEVIIREAYFNSLKSTPTKESIRFSYLDSCKKGFTGSYREYCKHLQIIHQQEQMKAERKKERAHHLESSYPSPCPRCGYQRKE